MPAMNGFEAMKHIRERKSAVPIVLSSGYDVDASNVDLRGLRGILEKPYDVAQLLAAVERALDRSSV